VVDRWTACDRKRSRRRQVVRTCLRIHASSVGIARRSVGGTSSRPWSAVGKRTTVKSLPSPLRSRSSVAALFLRRLGAILAAVDPDPGHGQLLEERNRVEASGMQLPRELRPLLARQRRRVARILAGKLAPLCFLVGCYRRTAGERRERDATLGANDGERNDQPA
jgi:hypothetical protein